MYICVYVFVYDLCLLFFYSTYTYMVNKDEYRKTSLMRSWRCIGNLDQQAFLSSGCLHRASMRLISEICYKGLMLLLLLIIMLCK